MPDMHPRLNAAPQILVAWVAANKPALRSDHDYYGKDPERLGEYLGKALMAVVKELESAGQSKP